MISYSYTTSKHFSICFVGLFLPFSRLTYASQLSHFGTLMACAGVVHAWLLDDANTNGVYIEK